MNSLMSRISLNSEVCNGQPTIRNMRFTVSQMLELLAGGMTANEILADYSYIEQDDINACLLYASYMAKTKSVLPLAS
ncbi:MAG: DUF433 domain-containing protein [Bacteroidetes bacterium]|nr:DUF433 domain-containing protein [Bacteroidota bacterium]